MMDYVAIFFAIWILICWQLIAHTIRENPELHLVYKRPKWMQRRFDKIDSRKLSDYQTLKNKDKYDVILKYYTDKQ